MTITGIHRHTSTSLDCSPASVVIAQPTVCTATVTDIGPGRPHTPRGKVAFATDQDGKFAAPRCVLSGSRGSSSCQLSYTPAAVGTGQHTVTAFYEPHAAHRGSRGQAVVAVALRSTSTALGCRTGPVEVGDSILCTVTVTDTSPGAVSNPQGAVRFSASKADGVAGSPCTLSGSSGIASCRVTYTPGVVGSGTRTLSGQYRGDPQHHGPSHGRTTIAVWGPSPNLNGEYFDSGKDNPPSIGANCDANQTFEFSADGRAVGMYSGDFSIDGTVDLLNGAITGLKASFSGPSLLGVITLGDPSQTSFYCSDDPDRPPEVGFDGTLNYTAKIFTTTGVRYDSGTVFLHAWAGGCGCGGGGGLRAYGFTSRQPPDNAVITYPNFATTSGLVLNGSASKAGNDLQLTSGAAGEIGSAWSQTPISPARSFEARFNFSLGDNPPAFGLAFVIQRDPAGTAALGRGGSEVGFGGLVPAVAVAFDSYLEMGVYVNGTPVPWSEGGLYHQPAIVDYNAFTHQLSIFSDASGYLGGMTTGTVDLASVLGGPEPALIGFTAASQDGGTAPNQLSSWVVSAAG